MFVDFTVLKLCKMCVVSQISMSKRGSMQGEVQSLGKHEYLCWNCSRIDSLHVLIGILVQCISWQVGFYCVSLALYIVFSVLKVCAGTRQDGSTVAVISSLPLCHAAIFLLSRRLVGEKLVRFACQRSIAISGKGHTGVRYAVASLVCHGSTERKFCLVWAGHVCPTPYSDHQIKHRRLSRMFQFLILPLL